MQRYSFGRYNFFSYDGKQYLVFDRFAVHCLGVPAFFGKQSVTKIYEDDLNFTSAIFTEAWIPITLEVAT